MFDNILEHYIENAVDTSQLGGYSANFKRFQNILKKVKKALQNLPTLHIEKEVSGLVQWVSRVSTVPWNTFESIYATGFNFKAFTYIKLQATHATKELAIERGEAPDISGSGNRNSHLLAIALTLVVVSSVVD